MEPSEVRSGKKKEKRGGNPQFRILIICVFIVIEIIILFLHISGTLDTIQYIILLVITIVLFISSLSLILSSKKLNQSNLQESARARDEREKERLRLLRVKMDNFYGPLFRNLPKFHVGDRERTKRDFIDPFMSCMQMEYRSLIPGAHILEWQAIVPWPNTQFVEHDLILSRVIFDRSEDLDLI